MRLQQKEREIRIYKACRNFKTERMTMLGRLLFLFLIQAIVSLALILDLLLGHAETVYFSCYPTNILVVITRFFCGIVLHFSLNDKLAQGLQMQKYVLNHYWKFRYVGVAWSIGACQMSMVFIVETINMVILCSNNSVMDVILNFLALVVIADFDDMFA